MLKLSFIDDEIILRLDDNSNSKFNSNYDAYKINTEGSYIYSRFDNDSINYSINYISLYTIGEGTIYFNSNIFKSNYNI